MPLEKYLWCCVNLKCLSIAWWSLERQLMQTYLSLSGVGAIVHFQVEFPIPMAEFGRVFLLHPCEKLIWRRHFHSDKGENNVSTTYIAHNKNPPCCRGQRLRKHFGVHFHSFNPRNIIQLERTSIHSHSPVELCQKLNHCIIKRRYYAIHKDCIIIFMMAALPTHYARVDNI